MNKNTTATGILDDLHSKLEKSKRTGDKLKARCPAHEDKTPSLDAAIGRAGDRVVVHCKAGCTTEDVIAAIGWDMRDLFASDDGFRSYEARDIGAEAHAVELEDTPLPAEVPVAVREMVLSIHRAEGDVEARLRVLRSIAASEDWAAFDQVIRCAVFDAVKGAGHLMATAILGRFDARRAAWVDPPAPDVEPREAFKSIWEHSAEDAPVALIPGVAWRGMVSMICSAPKLGKTSLIANGIAAWQAARPFLGESCGPQGSVLYVSETPVGLLQSWLTRYGCPAGAPIIAGGVATSSTIAGEAAAHIPDVVVIDSVTDLFAASGAGNLWNAGDVRKLIQPLRALGCAVVLVHHVRKSDGTARDSSDLTALTDQNVTFDPGYAFGGGDPPTGARRLSYFGRWPEPTRELTFTEADGYSLDGSTPGVGSTGGGHDPFFLGVPGEPLDARIRGYLMQHPASSGRHIRAALGCQQRDLRPALDRLAGGGEIESHKGPRGAGLWTVTLTGSPTANPIFEPLEPVPVH